MWALVPILLIESVILPHIEPASARDLLCTRVDPCWLPVSSPRVIRGFHRPAFPVISGMHGISKLYKVLPGKVAPVEDNIPKQGREALV